MGIKEKIGDKYQEEICELCESQLLGCKSVTSTFICEGRYCEEAFELFLENEETTIQRKILQDKINKIKKIIL